MRPSKERETALPGCGSSWSSSLDWAGNGITAASENHLRRHGNEEEREEARKRGRVDAVREEGAQQCSERAADHQPRQDRAEDVAVARVAEPADDPRRKDHEERYPLRDVLRVALSEDQD